MWINQARACISYGLFRGKVKERRQTMCCPSAPNLDLVQVCQVYLRERVHLVVVAAAGVEADDEVRRADPLLQEAPRGTSRQSTERHKRWWEGTAHYTGR